MRIFRRLLPVALLLTQAAQADTLLQVYEKALQSDPQVREAEANRMAVLEGKPIARGALLPQVSGQMTIANNATNGGTSTFFGSQQSTRVVDSRDNDARNWVLQLRQSIFRWDQWITLSQAGKKSAQADADYQAAQQDLIVRVASTYFLILAAEDTLASQQAAKESIGRQLEQAQKRFEVGLIAITDVQEAQAAYDQAVTDEILAKRALANNWEALRTIIDEIPPTLAKPAADIPLVSPDPDDVETWVNTAQQQNRNVISSQIGTRIAKDDVGLARTGHYPTVDLVLSRNNTNNEGFSRAPCFQAPQDLDGNNAADLNSDPNRDCVGGNPAGTIVRTPTGTDLETDSISLQLSLPIFSGGQTSARVQQAVYRHRASRERLERTQRETEQQTRDAYLGVISDISRVTALKQALESSRTALKASEAGYEVGTRTAVDVLDAKRKTFVAEALYLRSRYDYLINGLRLKQAAGTLAVDDLAQVDTLLK